jgi:uncharacterized membrane protein
MHRKGFVNIILVVVIVILVGAVGYFAFVKKSEPVAQQPTPTPVQTKTPISPIPTSETTNLKTYTNSQYGYQIKYPKDWTVATSGFTAVGFRAPNTKPQLGDFVADVYVVFEASSIQKIIDAAGSQFSDRKVVREDITIGNNVPAVKFTVSTPSYPEWIFHSLLVEVVSGVLDVNDGAQNTPEFWSIASTFELTK